MKKYTLLIIASALALLPFAVFAADVNLTENVTLTLPSDSSSSFTLLSNSSFTTLEVGNSSFTFSIPPGSNVEVIGNQKQKLTNTQNVTTTCEPSQSRVLFQIAATGATTSVEITPSGDCSVAASGTAGGGSSGGGGGGGGGGTSSATTPASSPVAAATTPSPSAAVSPISQPSSQTPVSAPSISVPSSYVSAAVIITRPLTLGMKGEDVRILQQYLSTDPSLYPEGTISGYFGALTKAAVERFQEKYSIASAEDPGYGTVGPKTRAKLKELTSVSVPAVSTPTVPSQSPPQAAGPTPSLVISRPLSMGSRGDDVRALQEYFATDPSLYPEGTISGYFGAFTKAAVERFQEKYSIASAEDPGYGTVGPKTRAKLNDLFGGSSPAQSPPTSPPTQTPLPQQQTVESLQQQIKALLEQLERLKKQQ